MSNRVSQAAIFHGPNVPLRIEPIPLPEKLASGHIVVRVGCCTICGSDLHTASGKRQEPTPCILGHETVGRVDMLGPEPVVDIVGRNIQPGDRVVWSVAVSCDPSRLASDRRIACRNCRRGWPQKCSNLVKYGHARQTNEWQLNGGLSEYCHLIPGTKIAVVQDETIPDAVLCLSSCAVATARAAMGRVSDLHSGRVLIIGAGMLGLSAAAMCATAGAEQITVCDLVDSRLELARSFGASDCVLWQQLLEGKQKFDVIFEMSGNPAATRNSLKFADVGATIVWVGSVFPTEPVAIPPEQLVRKLITLTGVHNYRPSDLVGALDFLSRHHTRFPFAELIGQLFSLRDINDAFNLAATSSLVRVGVIP